MRSLRRKIRRLEDRVSAFEQAHESSPSNEYAKLFKLVEYFSDAQNIFTTLAKSLFSEDELVNSSRTGKRTNKCNDIPRPAIDQVRFQTLEGWS